MEHRIVNDLTDFEKYVVRWHKIFRPVKTTIDGNIVGLKNMTVDERLEITRLTKMFNDARLKKKQRLCNQNSEMDRS